MGQMSFYSADALPRAVTDLEGVLCAGGVLTLFGRGTAARLAIVLGTPPPEIEVPDDEAVPTPDDEAVPATGPAHDERDAVAVGGPSGSPPGPGEHRAARGVPAPDAAPQVPAEHGADWDEGVDEIPDDEFPVRDDGPPAAAPDEPPPGPEPAPPAVVTPDPVTEWRAHALCCAFRGRGVPADVERLPDGRLVVRSAYRADLVPLADAWRRPDGALAVPGQLDLDGPRLRLWVLAAGRRRGRAYTLGLDPHARATHEPLLTACQRAGLGATLAGDEDEPVVAIVGQRRQRRLAELVGGRPRTLVDDVWPG
ncbi:hypothetical protein [Actinomycetospora sp. TBRC 11914]|uniref:hypothetical protein n=1 Tax=Actinomycetospora sp. TBRC 11914 TaxID=2729387 RepID=UPI00145C5AB3|nr:hypothetical protein [Actinomycetospora sp. TBRC 11914]NMO92208.1 hypothetical protein [Actinomycetospora sp. TBRC 11914]